MANVRIFQKGNNVQLNDDVNRNDYCPYPKSEFPI